MRVLVVEDDADLGQCLCDLVASVGHEAALATTASAAVRLLDSFQPDALIVDIRLPAADGNAVAMEARRRRQPPRVVAVTSWPDLAERIHFDRVFCKPFSPEELLATLTAGVTTPPVVSRA